MYRYLLPTIPLMAWIRFSSQFTFVCLLCSQVHGCGPRYVSPPEPVDQGSFLVHRVANRGESLSIISSWYTGSEKQAKQIAKTSGLTERVSLKVGQRVLIPSALVKKTTPLPKSKATPKAGSPTKIASSGHQEAGGVVVSGDDTEPVGDDIEWQIPKEDIIPVEESGDKVVGVPNEQDGPTATSDATATSGGSETESVPSDVAETFEQQLARERSEVERLRQEMQSGAPVDAD